jgi:acyl-CoA thioesterase-1
MTYRIRASSRRWLACGLLVAAAAAAMAGCRKAQPAASAAQPALDVGPAPKPAIVVLGDSITAGFGLLASEAYPGLLQQKLEKDGYDFEVENAGVTGDTTAGALRRLDWALGPNVKILVVALGGNDALRGLSTSETHDNLTAIIKAARAKGIEVLVAGMEAPPNLGDDYKTNFHDAFAAIARDNPDVAFVPFLLAGVAGKPELNQADGMHPNAKGAEIVAALIYEKLKPLVANLAGHDGGGLPPA